MTFDEQIAALATERNIPLDEMKAKAVEVRAATTWAGEQIDAASYQILRRLFPARPA